MDTKIAKTLFSLSETDSQILVLKNESNMLVHEREQKMSFLDQSRARLVELEGLREEISEKKRDEDALLKQEEQRISERRKQLTAIGGVKAAKLVERELDVATRALQTMEENLSKSIEELENVDAEIDELKSRVDALEAQLSEEEADYSSELTQKEKELKKLESTQEKQLESLTPSLKSLYSRVGKRYPGDAVAVAKEGACRSCYRALPAQTFNQILAGNTLIQCPGCSRILVYQSKN